MSWGGARPGAGRPKKSVEDRSLAIAEQLRELGTECGNPNFGIAADFVALLGRLDTFAGILKRTSTPRDGRFDELARLLRAEVERPAPQLDAAAPSLPLLDGEDG